MIEDRPPPGPHIALNAHLLSGEDSYRSAGIHGYLFNTLAHLPEAAPDLRFTVFTGSGTLPENVHYPVIRSRLPTQRPLVRIAWEQIVGPFALARAHPDLLHGMAFALPLAWAGPSVITIFDLSFIRYPGRLNATRRLYLRAIVGASARRAERIIAISESTRQEVVALLGIPAEKIDIAYPGANPDYHPLDVKEVDTFRQQQGLPDRFILYLGTLEPRKNLTTLIRAYAALPQRPEVKLVLAGGKGWGYEPIFTLIEELGLQDDVITPGYQPGNSLPMWYNSPELFVYPSVYEGFGMPLVEAMACGTPVIAANTTSLPEAVGNAGLLVPAGDPAAWTEAMSGLLTNSSTRAEWSEKGRLHAATFAWAETANRTVDTYRRVLKLNRPS